MLIPECYGKHGWEVIGGRLGIPSHRMLGRALLPVRVQSSRNVAGEIEQHTGRVTGGDKKKLAIY